MIIMRCKHVRGMGFDLGQFCGLSLMLKLIVPAGIYPTK